jgi:hypothetical protein
LPPQLTLGPKQTQLLQGLSAYSKAVRRLRRWHDYRFCGAGLCAQLPGMATRPMYYVPPNVMPKMGVPWGEQAHPPLGAN